MDEASNPYAPGAGTRPPELAGRESILKDARVTIQRVRAGRSSKSFIFIGLRGVGKTVLLNEVQIIAEELDCKTIHIEAHDGKTLPQLLVPPLKHLLISLDNMAKATDATRRALRVLRSFVSSVKIKMGDIDVGIGLPPEKGSADSGDLEADLISVLLAVGEAAKSRNRAVVISIDGDAVSFRYRAERLDHGRSSCRSKIVACAHSRRRSTAARRSNGAIQVLRRAPIQFSKSRPARPI